VRTSWPEPSRISRYVAPHAPSGAATIRPGSTRIERETSRRLLALGARSEQRFSTDPVLDRFRYLLFATGSRTPYRTLAIANAGWAELNLGNLGEARRCFETALSEVPGDRNSRRGLANVIAREKLYEEGEG